MTTGATHPDRFAARIAAARTGDGQAWSELYHAIAPLLIGYLRAQRLPDPEDVAGEVLLEVVRDLGRFEGDERGFRSWVLAIAHHRLLDARRRAQRRPATSVASDDLEPRRADDDPESETLAALGLGELEPALATLTDDQRNVLLLRVITDLSLVEVAAVLDKRIGAVKQLQRRAVDAMRRALDGHPRDTSGPTRGASDGRTSRAETLAVGAHPSGWRAP